MGIRKQFRNTPLGATIAFVLIHEIGKIGLARGFEEIEVSWILEDNKSMRGIIEMAGNREYKRYRIFGKTL